MQLTPNQLIEKWDPILNLSEDLKGDALKTEVTARLLENQESHNESQSALLNEAAPTTNNSGIAKYDPVMISMVRRIVPNLVAFDLASVQPMTQPTGLIFCLKPTYASGPLAGQDAYYNEPSSGFSGIDTTVEFDATPTPDIPQFKETQAGDPSSLFNADGTRAAANALGDNFGVGGGFSTEFAEKVGTAGENPFQEMSFTIEKKSVEALTRKLKGQYSLEVSQDLQAYHNISADAELSNILAVSIVSQLNREVIRTINTLAVRGATNTAAAGLYNLDADADGRWSVEKYKGLSTYLEQESHFVSKATRFGRANYAIVSSSVATALNAAGMLDYAPRLSTSMQVDDTGVTYAGLLNNWMKIYIDPYAVKDYVTLGYKGSNNFAAGLYYCPYIPLTPHRAVDQNTFQPILGFSTRYALASNPFAEATIQNGKGNIRANRFFRTFAVSNVI